MNKNLFFLFVATAISMSSCADNDKLTKEKSNDRKERPPVQLEEKKREATDNLAKLVMADQEAPAVELRAKKSMMPMTTSSALYMQESVAGIGLHNTAWSRESYNSVEESGYIHCANDPLSTFSIDVDTASYANVRRFIRDGMLPPVGAVRIEEMINYFSYDYPKPKNNLPLSITTEVGSSPYNVGYELVKIGLQAKSLDVAELKPSNLVFLIDVSGSMSDLNKLPLLQQSMKLMVDKLTAKDRVSIVVYAGADRVVLEPTPGSEKETIKKAIDNLRSGGSTHASSGIQTAYILANQVYMPAGNNRVILASDGDFNVGTTSRDELQRLIELKRKSGVYLTVLGFGLGNYHDDTMEILADKGNGNYAYIDSLLEAKKVLVKEMSGTLFTIADDVKIQVEFNPRKVGAYRLIGYENRALNDEDFTNDKKDAGELGAGHSVTALYEIIPAGHKSIPHVDKLKYQQVEANNDAEGELLTVKVRYKEPGTEQSKEIVQIAKAEFSQAEYGSDDLQFAAAVAGYGMLLQNSENASDFSWEKCLALLKSSKGKDSEGYRAELLRLAEMSQLLQNKG